MPNTFKEALDHIRANKAIIEQKEREKVEAIKKLEKTLAEVTL